MTMTSCGLAVWEELKRLIDTPQKIILYSNPDPGIVNRILEIEKDKNSLRIEIWHTDEEIGNAFPFRYITKEVMKEIVENYRMYDFSDRVRLVSDSIQYGELFNYVKTGVLSVGDMVNALMCAK